jgi:hypothetical protein
MWVFEYNTKREFKFETPETYKEDYVIEGLRADDQKEFSEDTLHLRKYWVTCSLSIRNTDKKQGTRRSHNATCLQEGKKPLG